MGRQGQPRGAQVYAMCLSDGSQDPPLPRSHLRVGSGGEGVLLEIPAYLRPSKGQCQLDELPACFLGQLGRTDSRVQCHRCMDCTEMPRVLPNARSCHPALLQASAQFHLVLAAVPSPCILTRILQPLVNASKQGGRWWEAQRLAAGRSTAGEQGRELSLPVLTSLSPLKW